MAISYEATLQWILDHDGDWLKDFNHGNYEDETDYPVSLRMASSIYNKDYFEIIDDLTWYRYLEEKNKIVEDKRQKKLATKRTAKKS